MFVVVIMSSLRQLEETTANLKRMERVESKLIESESECSRLSDIVLTEIPQLKEDLAVQLTISMMASPVSRCLFLRMLLMKRCKLKLNIDSSKRAVGSRQ